MTEAYAIPDHITPKTIHYTGPLRVLLDGVEMKEVTEAHRGEGWIDAMVRNDAGEIMMDGEGILIKRHHGVVTFERV